jgi:hypothetical protein
VNYFRVARQPSEIKRFEGKRIHNVQLKYPPAGKSAHIEGTVISAWAAPWGNQNQLRHIGKKPNHWSMTGQES